MDKSKSIIATTYALLVPFVLIFIAYFMNQMLIFSIFIGGFAIWGFISYGKEFYKWMRRPSAAAPEKKEILAELEQPKKAYNYEAEEEKTAIGQTVNKILAKENADSAKPTNSVDEIIADSIIDEFFKKNNITPAELAEKLSNSQIGEYKTLSEELKK